MTTLTADLVRNTYLRGIDLGNAWTGPSADAAIMQLLAEQVAHAEALMNIHFRRWTVATLPDASAVPNQDYQVLGTPVPFVALQPEQTAYRLQLGHHDVHAVVQVRLFYGMNTFVTVPLDGMTFPMPEEHLVVPAGLVTPTGTEQAWAVDYVMGMAEIPLEVMTWCALGAAIEILALGGAGQDVSHGLQGDMLQMDGIEERITYGNQSRKGGLYAGPIAVLEDRRLDIDLVALRFRYQNTLGDRTTLPANAVYPTRVL